MAIVELHLGERLVPCVIVGRVNRFVVEVVVGGVRERAYNTNTGRLEELLVEGRVGYCVSRSSGRLRFGLVGVECCGAAALIDTRLQERVFVRLVEEGVLWWLRGCRVASRAPRVGSSRLDYLLDCGGDVVYVELKSAVLRGAGGEALYPDCPTDRGVRHVYELAGLAAQGLRALLVFIAGFPGARLFQPYARGDPRYPGALLDAIEAGVEVRAIGLYLEPSAATVVVYDAGLPVVPRPYR